MNAAARPALWNLGFRPFFLGAAWFGVTSVALWLWSFGQGTALYPLSLPASYWHAHELLFGYAAAVIAGFLLTATKNWTNRQTLHRLPLAALFLAWLAARITLLVPGASPWIAATLDLGFNAWLLIAVSMPIIATRQRQQYAILGKLVFLLLCNALFYAQLLDITDSGARFALYANLYVIIGLILMMSRRLIPFFTERGLEGPVSLRNSRAVDIASLCFFLGFFISTLFLEDSHWPAVFAGLLTPILAIRAAWWYTPGIWGKDLLWSLHLAYLAMVIGFALFALSPILGIGHSVALHTLTVGGIGLVTVAMMARVSWGHTGRPIGQPPRMLRMVFIAFVLSALARVAGPWLAPAHYKGWIISAGALWCAGMLAFALRYTPLWLSPRPDGQYG